MNTNVKKIGLLTILPLLLGCHVNVQRPKLEESLIENNYQVEKASNINEYSGFIYYDYLYVDIDDGLKTFIRGYKTETDYGLFWEFETIDKANDWINKYITNLYYAISDIANNASIGMFNFVVYAGAKTAIRASGIEIN